MKGKWLTPAHPQVTGAAAPGPDSRSHQRNSWAGRAGPRRRPDCIILSHHCPGPWYDLHSQPPFSLVTGCRQLQKVGKGGLRHPPPWSGAPSLPGATGLSIYISMAMNFPPTFLSVPVWLQGSLEPPCTLFNIWKVTSPLISVTKVTLVLPSILEKKKKTTHKQIQSRSYSEIEQWVWKPDPNSNPRGPRRWRMGLQQVVKQNGAKLPTWHFNINISF